MPGHEPNCTYEEEHVLGIDILNLVTYYEVVVSSHQPKLSPCAGKPVHLLS